MRRRRKGDGQPSEAEQPVEEAEAGKPAPAAEGPRAHGPWDASEHPVDEEDTSRAHLGALSIAGHPEVELRLQVDEASGAVAAVMLVAKDGAMELRAFAAARHEDLWEEIRPRLAAEAARRGGTATPVEGPFGTALHMMVPGTTPDGQKVTQPQTVLGIAGPRWLLRVTAFGRPAQEYRPDGLLETVLRSVVVTRGSQPMAPGEALPLVLPKQAQRVQPGSQPGGQPPA